MTTTAPVAVVTGAGRGIGAAIARRLHRDGYHVVVADLDSDSAKRVADEIDGTAAAVDITDPAAAAELSASLPRVDALVNNAGIFPPAPIATVSPAEFRKVMDVNVLGTLIMTQALIPQLTAAPEAAVVNVASIAAKAVTPGTAAYSPSKAAVVSLTKLCAVELAEFGIRVNAIAPGGVLTEGTANVSADEEREARFNALVPLGRRARPEDIADTVPFLLGPDARYVTGQILYVDGGLTEATINFLRAAQGPR
ncbi:SDR family oxidoreductase [Nocardia farcinica]|uniref:SDR family NAD(P)-dependent oxidoreductase n=1 Tax=Nocardia farcinica TaxID=37329 RepID=UPI000A375592|nr:SDR family NAD(P)-dependent oxidoreductase [Nocardia farcinica]MBA4857478.1 SDR family oxidoreductase [Nocardia farcinica]MBC9816223.1 SDR family oxidoreductase [Nocardia farcinica]MBF6072454.1 SDR family oxidoreductase [Nocardia farcinica]MBF6262374.1 SDR family oxidoreductase [Nocardia farcinica]MBF6280914.1 SDR family oxidoreductase [Nocardia farcinica]